MNKTWTVIMVALVLAVSWLFMAGFEFPWQEEKFAFTPTPIPSATKTDSPTPKATATPKASPSANIILYDVPFASQAPFGEWSDPRQQDGCEEASVMMAMHWVRSDMSLALEDAKKEILTISDWEQERYGSYHDTSAEDTVDRIFNAYYGYNNVRVEKNIRSADFIVEELKDGNLVIIPADGRALGNPYFTSPGPERHMLVIIGYDYSTDEFITNDPGTRSGRHFRYSRDTLFEAIRDYPSGYKVPITETVKNIIVVSK